MEDHTRDAADHVIRLGRGEPMLLLHGIGHRKEGWDPVLPLLGGRYDVAALDLPGFGGAPALDVPQTDVALADHCAGVMDALGWDTAHLVGNSLGGLVALRLASRGRARTVTALSPGGQLVGWERAWARGVLYTMRALAPRLATVGPLSDTALGRRLAMSTIFARPERMNPAYARLSMEGLAMATAFESTFEAVDWQVQLDEPVEVPVTIAWGTRDWLLPPQQGRRWTAVLPTARLVRLPGLGHTPMPDDPEMVADVVIRTAG